MYVRDFPDLLLQRDAALVIHLIDVNSKREEKRKGLEVLSSVALWPRDLRARWMLTSLNLHRPILHRLFVRTYANISKGNAKTNRMFRQLLLSSSILRRDPSRLVRLGLAIRTRLMI